MVDLAVEVVKAISSGAGDRLAAMSMEAVGRLTSALRAKLRGDASARGVLEIALEDPGDAGAREDLEMLLRERVRRDAEFSAWLEALWSEVEPDLKMDASKSANIVHGNVQGDVVQARDVHGGIHIGRRDDAPPARDGDEPTADANVFASGTADGTPWRLAVRNIAGPAPECSPMAAPGS